MEINRIQISPTATYGPNATSIALRPSQWQHFDPTPTAASAAQKADSSPDSEILTSGEKSYFEQLFPTAVDTVRSYHAYRRDGSGQSAALGSVVDRKG